MKENEVKTVFFSEIPDPIWEKIQPEITDRYFEEVGKYYFKFGEAYLRKNRPDNDDFYGFAACKERLHFIIWELTSGGYHCEVEKNESGFATITEDGKLLDVVFEDIHYQTLQDYFKMLDFLARKPEFESFYGYAYKLACGTIGANVLMNYSNLLASAPVKNNLEGAKELEKTLMNKYISIFPK
jgi:hypothetical protein